MEILNLYKCTTTESLQHQLRRCLLSSHCLLLLKRGRCTVSADNTLLSFGKGEFVHLSMTVTVGHTALQGVCYIISYSPELYCARIIARPKSDNKAIEHIYLSGRENSFAIHLISVTYRNFRTSSARMLEMFLVLCNFIIERKRPYQTRSDTLFNLFCELVDQNYSKEHKVSYYANILCITPGYLDKIVKSQIGIPPKAYVGRQLMLKALLLLSDTDFTVDKIAELLGFTEAGSFSTFFKRSTGVSPSSFRKEILKKKKP